MSRTLWLLALVIGCDAGEQSSVDCKQVGAKYVDACLVDHWDDAARTCMKMATNDVARQECGRRHLTETQRRVFDVETYVQVYERFTAKMCGCKDAACIQAVSDEMKRWGEAHMKHEDPKLTHAEALAVQKLGEEMANCMASVMDAGSSLAK